MPFITLNADLNRVATALERIALALERLSPPPLPISRASSPSPSPSPRFERPEALKREIISDLLSQGVSEDQAVTLSDLSDFELMKRGIHLDLDLADEILSEEV